MLSRNYSVVGNAPQDSSNAAKIDSAEHVLRFNNYKLGDHSSVVGSKVTHWVTSFYSDVVFREHQHILCPLPLNVNKYLVKYPGTNRANLKKAYVQFMPVDIYEDLIKLVPKPSTGIAMLYWIHRTYGLDRSRVFGFNMFDRSQPHQLRSGKHSQVGLLECCVEK